MRNFTWNRFPIKNLLIDSLLTSIVENTYLNRDMCKFESSQKDESRWQSTDSSKAYRNTSAFKWRQYHFRHASKQLYYPGLWSRSRRFLGGVGVGFFCPIPDVQSDHYLNRTLKLGIPVEMVQFLLKLLLKQRSLAVHLSIDFNSQIPFPFC